MRLISMTALGIAAALATTLGGTTVFGQMAGDKTFVTEAIQGDLAEVQVGKLAQSKGATEGVRNFGKMLETDHDNAKAGALNMAMSLSVEPPAQPMPEAQQEYTKLQGLSGAAFDAEFVKAMIEDHQKDIQKFEAEAKSGSGPAAKMAAAQLPTLKKHLETAQTLEKQASP